MNRFGFGRCHWLQSRITFVAIVGLSSGLSPACDPLTLVPLCDHKSAGLAFDRSMADLLCHRSFFSCKDNTLNV